MITNVPVNVPLFEGNEKKYLLDCIETGWISSAGEYIQKFESGMSEFVGQKYGIAVCNGTAALETAVMSLDLEKGSEVILPDFTIISCVQAIVKAGLVPVPVDCNLDDWQIDVSKIEERITPKTKAIMIVHIYGLPVDMDAIWKIAQKYNLVVIEDAAEAHGLTYRGKQCGSLGDISIFSFFPNKHITCGEGGMVLTSNDDYAKRASQVRNLFFDKERRYIHEEFGSNFRMTNMQAAIGLAQLERVNQTIVRKREIGRIYQEELSTLKSFQMPVEKKEYADNIYWVFGLVSREKELTSDIIMKKLGEHGIGTRHFFYPIHKQPALIKCGVCPEKYLEDAQFENSNYISEYGFYIPSGVGMSYEEQKYVIRTIKLVFG